MFDIVISFLRGDKFGAGEVAQAGDMVGMEMGDENTADIRRLELSASQLRDHRQLRIEAQRRGVAIEAERQAARDLKHARRIAGIPQQPTLPRMVQQRHQRVAGNTSPLPSLHNVRLPGKAVAGIQDMTSHRRATLTHTSSSSATSVRSMASSMEIGGVYERSRCAALIS